MLIYWLRFLSELNEDDARWPVKALLTARAFYNGAVAIGKICVLDGTCLDVFGV